MSNHLDLEVRMIKKLLWMTIAVLVAAVAFYIMSGEGFAPTPTEIAPTQCVECGSIVATQQTTPQGDWVTLEPTLQYTYTPTAKPTKVPPTVTSTRVLPTATSTRIPPTVTPTMVPPTATKTLAPTKTSTPIPTNTPTATVVPSATPTYTPTPSFAVQVGVPVYLTNFAHTDSGCNWEGIAGQVFNKYGTPIRNYIIKVSGTYNGQVVNLIGITSMTSGKPYGMKGYEIVLGNKSVHSTGLLTIQLFDPNGVAVTDPISVATYSACSKNLIIYNFMQK
jgi:hypothetical protein